MPQDKVATSIVNWVQHDLERANHHDRWYGRADHMLLDVTSTDTNLTLWLENAETGEKVRYKLSVEKISTDPA